MRETNDPMTPRELREIADWSRDHYLSSKDRDKLRAHAAQLERNAWEPISTAPKDGLLVLTFAIVDSETGNWNMKISCRWEVGGPWLNWAPAKPTHWRPLPKPPEAT